MSQRFRSVNSFATKVSSLLDKGAEHQCAPVAGADRWRAIRTQGMSAGLYSRSASCTMLMSPMACARGVRNAAPSPTLR